ncbi:glycosyltransferase [Geodermatophilus maliterrae]|uniref:Glycosyltransferase n=1 Tax=Geodermatophilus maliterrae TaxID=3162531 RepID=A0ABV3XLE2_9ACTN
MRVSVLVTAYEHQAYVGRAIEGVLQQTGVPFELIVGDDCSSDDTRSVVADLARRHPDTVRVHFPDTNRGRGGKVLFSDLVGLSRGEYIAGLDGDDYWNSPEKLRTQVAHLDRHPECAMVFHNVIRTFEDDARPDELYLTPTPARRLGWQDLLRSNPVPACSPLFRREVLDPLPPWYFELPWGDWPLYFLAAQHGEIDYLPGVWGVFRFHGRGLYSGLPDVARRRSEVEFFRRLEGVLPPAVEADRRRRLALALSRLAAAHLALGERRAARTALADSFRVWPPDPRRLRRGEGERARLYRWARTRLPFPLPAVDDRRATPRADPRPTGRGTAARTRSPR